MWIRVRCSVPVSHDWDAWARRVERALDVATRSDTDFQDLFAPDAVYIDPTQTAVTSELPEVSRHTKAAFPDWTTEVVSIRGSEKWAALEWIGRGTYTPHDELGATPTAIELPGVTLVDIDGSGLVTRWRDYFDMKAVEDKIRSTSESGPS